LLIGSLLLFAIIKRNENFITPNGSTIIEANDNLVVLSESQGGLDKVEESLRNQNGG